MKFSQTYLDDLFSPDEYGKLAEISALICGSDSFNPEEPDYGLDGKTFAFIECLLWFAQGLRSGVWTYYEATPPERQHAMLSALKETSPSAFATYYALGMETWEDEDKITEVDDWLRNEDEKNHANLWHLVTSHRESIQQLFA